MLSAVIHTKLSYSTMLLAEQPIHQRFVLSGPLVLGKTSLKHTRLQQIETNLSHALFQIPLLPMAWTIPPSHTIVGDRRVILIIIYAMHINQNLNNKYSSLYGVNKFFSIKCFSTTSAVLIRFFE